MASIEEHIAHLSPDQMALLAKHLQEKRSADVKMERIPRREDPERAILSFSQLRLWFLDQVDPGNPAYNIPAVVRLEGALNIPALEFSFAEIIRRHEILHTCFISTAGEPVQVINPYTKFPLAVVDLTGTSPLDRDEQVNGHIKEEALAAFNLSTGPLIRAALLKLAGHEHLLLLTFHHIVADGWSMNVFVRELAAFYSTYTNSSHEPLPNLPVQYADYAEWQRGWLRVERLEREVEYWTRQLSGSSFHLELPTDYPRPAVQSHQGGHVSAQLSPVYTARLRELCRQEGVTPFMALLAAFQVFLHKYTGQDDLCVGTPIANRKGPGLDALIGMFVNTLVIRSQMLIESTFLTYLKSVRETCLAAFSNGELPFEILVERLQQDRDLSCNPIFQAMFAYQDDPLNLLQLPGLTISQVESETGTSKFDLLLVLNDRGEKLSGYFEYNTDLFKPETVLRMASHFQILLEKILDDPGTSLASISLLSLAERDQILRVWNDTALSFPENRCAHQLFEQRAAETPAALACACQGQQLTYAGLNRRANQLAHHLMQLGFGPGQIAGLCTERSIDLLTGAIAALKAGGAYLPLDPTYPAERLAFMLADSGATLLLTQKHLLGDEILAALPSNLSVVCLDADWNTIALANDFNPPHNANATDLAYVIYTSGSTGRPKGVPIRHLSLLNLIYWHQQRFEVTSVDRATQLAGQGFDASVWEIWPYLSAGASLHIPDEETRAAPNQLRDWLIDQEITIAFLPTPMAESMLSLDWPMDTKLRTVLTGGDRLHVYPSPGLPFELVNNYGPTESTVVTTSGVVPTYAAAPGVPPSIGRPIANTRVYVLDKHLQPVPIGMLGELYIAGTGLSAGYLNRPELSAERFLPNPFSLDPNDRMYRTGDRVRWLPDGNLEFFGRLDFQVKLRGFRVELGEIETLLVKHPAIEQAAVLLQGETPENQRLVGYLVLREPAERPSYEEMLVYLKRQLPDYMLPSVFVLLDVMPLTPNTKVDRKALPLPGEGNTLGPISGQEAPASPLEGLMAGIWAQVLGRSVVGRMDNFFAIGGHSLLATRLVTQVRSVFGLDIPIRSLFEAPTLSGFTRTVEARMQTNHNRQVPPIKPAGNRTHLPLSFAQQRLWFLNQYEPDNPSYNLFIAIRIRGSLDAHLFQSSLDMLAKRHEALRTAFQTVDGAAVQMILPEASIPCKLVNLVDLQADARQIEVDRWLETEPYRPFDLAAAPLMRVTLLHLEAEETMALFSMHHIISDGWSNALLIRDLKACYESLLAGTRCSLPELTIQYADYAAWQRDWLQGDVLDEKTAYWKELLSGCETTLDLPTDRPRPAVQTSNGGNFKLDLDETFTQSIRSFSQQEGVTPFMLLLAVFETLLYRYTAQADFCIGTPIANRIMPELEGVVGFFVNTLVLRADMKGSPTFRELLARVRETCLNAYTHQDMPFEKLLDALQIERDLSRNPLFQVMFVLQNAERAALCLPGLSLESLDLDTHLAMFDLSLILEDSSSTLSGGFEFNTDLFDSATIAQLARHFSALLSAALASPDTPVSSLPFLSQPELDTLLHSWNDTQVDWPQLSSTFHALFELQAARSPDATAACSIADGSSLSFAQLNAQANRLARHLRSLGAAPDACVALCLERSLLLPVALLAVLKAGAAFLPLDPAFPPERTTLMLEETQASILLTSSSLASALPESGCTILSLDDLLPQLASLDPCDLPPLSSPDHLAYVLYTSGSTGRPKGVLVDNRAMLNHNLAAADLFELSPADRVLQFASLTFDTAVEEFFPAWLSGAAVFLRPPGALPDAATLLEWVERFSLSVLDLPTAFWHEWAAELPLLPLPLPPCLRLVVVGGEKALPERLSAWLSAVGPRPAWLNTYGPTEGTIIASSYSPPPSFSPAAPLPIGRPIPNVRLYVLDSLLQPVPPRVPGELCIAGLGVARGYLLRPELSAQRFLPDPFCPSQRLFRTGDRARFLPDGSIEFLGRFDDQLKLRGFRIEPGEVVSALLQHPALSQAAVLPFEFAPGQLRLVAYLVTLSGAEEPSAEDLRAFLRARLPEFMLPSAFLFLPALPLTSSAKLDRRALPKPAFESASSPSSSNEPLSPTEAALAAIWQQVLGLPSVGRFDNFFALGGDSILSIQVVARANQAGFHLSPRLLFEHPSLADLAAALPAAPALSAVDQSPASGPYPLSPIQSWFFDLALPAPQHWNQSLLLALPRRLDPGALQLLSLALLAHHDVLRSSFSRSESAWQVSIAPAPRPLPIPCEDLSALVPAAQDAALLAALEACQARFDLEAFDLFQLAFFWLGPQRGGRLFLAAHHLVVDGLSWRILLEDLHAALSSLDAGLPIRLPPRSASFPAWSARLAQLAASPAILDTLPFWLALAAIPPAPLPALPSAPLRAPESSAVSLSLALSPADTRRFLADAPAALHAEPLSLLLAALAQALLAWAGPGFFPIELEGHGREDLPDPLDLSRSAGWFTALFPFPLDLRAAPSPAGSLAQVKAALRSLPLHGLPFSLLLAHPPSPQVGVQLRQAAFPSLSFNYLGQWDAAFPNGALFSLAEEPRGFERDPAAPRSHPLILTAAVIHAALQLELSFSPDQFSLESVQALLEAFHSALLALLALHPDALSLNPQDFPDVDLSQEDLTNIIDEIGEYQ